MKQLVLLLLISLSLNAHKSHIVEHHHFHRLLDFVFPEDLHNKTIIVLDIDNTIAQPKGKIGSEEWVVHVINKWADSSITDSRARFQIIAPLYFDIIHSVDFIPIELITIDIIRELQQAGVLVIGLTARSFQVCDRTIEQLYNIGIDLSHASVWHEDLWYEGHLNYCHKQGIIFCDGNDKGKVLSHVFEQLNYYPSKIIAIDDKERHLHAIARAINPEIEFVGIRYGHLDEKVRNFDGVAADEELLELIIWQWLFNEVQLAFMPTSVESVVLRDPSCAKATEGRHIKMRILS